MQPQIPRRSRRVRESGARATACHPESARALTDAAESPVQSYDYDLHGTTQRGADGTSNPSQYTGREHDQSGLYYYRARCYHPGPGRYISEDPIGLASGPDLYTYVDGIRLACVIPRGSLGSLRGQRQRCGVGRGPVPVSAPEGRRLRRRDGTFSTMTQYRISRMLFGITMSGITSQMGHRTVLLDGCTCTLPLQYRQGWSIGP